MMKHHESREPARVLLPYEYNDEAVSSAGVEGVAQQLMGATAAARNRRTPQYAYSYSYAPAPSTYLDIYWSLYFS
eukprot:scaffold682766_cov62-Prasinocladus_malaysianus.AAC.1